LNLIVKIPSRLTTF